MAYKKFEPFTYKTLSDFERKIRSLNLGIPISSEVEILQQRIRLGSRFIPNRLAIQPMEGADSLENGSPSDLTYRRYERFAKGGAGLIWFEATAINNGSRTTNHQLMLTEDNKNDFKRLVSQTRDWSNQSLKDLGFKDPSLLILQLNHSGKYSSKAKQDSKLAISDYELDELEDIWVRKAILAREIGFDGVDIKACHGYLISDLLASRTQEGSNYQGNQLENRTRFLLNIIKKLKNEINQASDFFITTRLGVYDGVPYPNGFGVQTKDNEEFPASIDISEPLQLITDLYNLGIRLINITAGNPHQNAHITRPYDTPTKGEDLPNEHPLYGVSRILNLAASIKEKVPEDMVMIGSGYSYLRQYAGYVAAGLIQEKKIDICGFGRMAFANPDFPRQIFQNGIINKKQTCITCSRCAEIKRQGKSTGCFIRDSLYQKRD